MTKMIFNALRAVANEHRIPEQDTDALVAALGEDLEAAIADRLRELSVDQSRTLRGHTELEASLRWCPHVREVTPVGKGPKDVQVGNRFLDRDGSQYNNPAGCCCTASLCMMWRRLDPKRGFRGLAGEPRYQPPSEPRRFPDRKPLERPDQSLQKELFDE